MNKINEQEPNSKTQPAKTHLVDNKASACGETEKNELRLAAAVLGASRSTIRGVAGATVCSCIAIITPMRDVPVRNLDLNLLRSLHALLEEGQLTRCRAPS